jgi:hypothetical protein
MNAHEIDTMSNTEMDAYWRGKSRAEFVRCSQVVQAFVMNRANMDLLRSSRPGMIGKAAIAVAEGMTLTRDSWQALFGYGREHPSSAQSAA